MPPPPAPIPVPSPIPPGTPEAADLEPEGAVASHSMPSAIAAPSLAPPAPDAPSAKRSRSTTPRPPVTGAAPLANQVAGHAGVMTDESGSLVIKPALAREIAFYQLTASAPRSAPIAGLRPFLPKFYGTLNLHGVADGQGGVTPIDADVPESIVLENLSHLFTRPCVMDAKLGTSLHGPDATAEKAERMAKKAAETTSGSTGIRLTGCQTWHVPSQSFIATPRGFGYNLTEERLPEGLVRFFPLPDDSVPYLSDTDTSPHDDYKDHALPPPLAARVLSLLDDELARLEAALSTIELRAVGASVLVVYEGDPVRLEQALERFAAKRVTLAARSLAEGLDDDDDEEESDEEIESDSEDSDTDDGVKADERRAAKCPPLVVRLIDFAHTWLVEGEGPDQGVLLGLKTFRGLVQRRRDEVEAWIAQHS